MAPDDGKKPADAPTGTGTGTGSDGRQQQTTTTTTTRDVQRVIDSLSLEQLGDLIALDPKLAREVAQATGTDSATPEQAAALLRTMRLEDLAAATAATAATVKGAKDMAAYRFWATQPVPRFGDGDDAKSGELEDGPLRIQTVDDVPAEPAALVGGFEWVTMDLTDDKEIKEVYELLNGHYVEDDNSTFRFNYSPSILRWAMMAPGWDKRYHVGVRASQSRKLVAFISAIPVRVRVRGQELACSEVNFLCVHKKLRGKRLAPVLIREVTRLSNREGVWQGLYTAGVVLPRPVSTCQYYHRPLRWQKLYDVGFSYLPRGSRPAHQVRRYAVPDATATPGWRPMEPRDVDAVTELQRRYSRRFDVAPHLSRDEIAHWLLAPASGTGTGSGTGSGSGSGSGSSEQVVWSYVVETDGAVTDFISFYCVESSVISNARHSALRVAYLFYYATGTGLAAAKQPASPDDKDDRDALKTRLNQLVADALVEAHRAGFDVFNALTLMDNGLFLEQQKFARGDGQLHYYLFNYRTAAVAGGIDAKGQLDAEKLSGLGLVLP